MNTGVSTTPCPVVTRPRRAAPSRANTSNPIVTSGVYRVIARPQIVAGHSTVLNLRLTLKIVLAEDTADQQPKLV
jgi:hypothetical protein